jgi:hypothetical protein
VAESTGHHSAAALPASTATSWWKAGSLSALRPTTLYRR